MVHAHCVGLAPVYAVQAVLLLGKGPSVEQTRQSTGACSWQRSGNREEDNITIHRL